MAANTDNATLARHRTAMRKAYLHAVNDIGGVGTFDDTDDLFMELMDKRLEDVMQRGQVIPRLPQAATTYLSPVRGNAEAAKHDQR